MFDLFNDTSDPIDRMDNWFGKQNFKLILCVGGNHDSALEKRLALTSTPFTNAVYLHGESYQYDGVNFFGASWVPDLSHQAFYADEPTLENEWACIPKNTDVLITHTPPFGVLDQSSRGMVLGCKHLHKAVKKIKPKLHCFGHVHASSGQTRNRHTTFINAAVAGAGHQLVRDAYSVEI